MKNNQINELNKVGQSVWYDNLSKDVLVSGKLKSLLDAGVSGLTSNPTIFKKAIADSSNYDADIKELSKEGLNVAQITEELMVRDVARAADLLRAAYDSSKGTDGCASIEVSPLLAADAKGSLEEARRLWKKLSRPNIMIKIPATSECIPVIKELLSEGVNVNVTLIFSVDVYAEVAKAYIEALEDRVKKGQPVDHIASVASFFVSRVDAICEKKFDEMVKQGKAKEADKASFFGKIGIANSKSAYSKYKELFLGERFSKLQAKGAHVQRPLWASTGTKNPTLSPVLYIEGLAGKNTVTTCPPETLEALMKQCNVSNALDQSPEAAKESLAGLAKLGLNLNAMLTELQTQGVKLFADSYNDLTNSVQTKQKSLTS